jgi:hypothetical protein
MASVTLVHPEETLRIPIPHAMTKCNLFQNNPALLTSPYRLQSCVSLSIFREFVSELEGNAAKITDTNLIGFQLLCKEFGFAEFAAKLSNFFTQSEDSQKRQLGSPFAGMRSALLNESFEFVVNGTVIEMDFAESLIFPAVREQLSVDGCSRKFFLKDSSGHSLSSPSSFR